MKALTTIVLLVLALAAYSAPPILRMTWTQDLRPQVPYTVRVDTTAFTRRVLLSAGPGDRSIENRSCNVLSALGIPHSVNAAQTLNAPEVEAKVIVYRGALRKAVGLKP